MKPTIYALGLMALLVETLPAPADSIWDRRDRRSAYLFVDNRARQVGDLVTVVIRETTDIDHRDEREMEKKTDSGGLFKLKGSSSAPGGSSNVAADFDTSATTKRSFDGKAEFSSEREFTDRITAVVVDVLPNGNLLIKGRRRRVIAGEVRTLVLTGIVRPSDIGPTNMVESRYIADFHIQYQGKGAESSFAAQGWFSRLISRLWPF